MAVLFVDKGNNSYNSKFKKSIIPQIELFWYIGQLKFYKRFRCTLFLNSNINMHKKTSIL